MSWVHDGRCRTLGLNCSLVIDSKCKLFYFNERLKTKLTRVEHYNLFIAISREAIAIGGNHTKQIACFDIKYLQQGGVGAFPRLEKSTVGSS